jgi:hypothetical protein
MPLSSNRLLAATHNVVCDSQDLVDLGVPEGWDRRVVVELTEESTEGDMLKMIQRLVTKDKDKVLAPCQLDGRNGLAVKGRR